MTIDLTFAPKVLKLSAATRAFVLEEVLPIEDAFGGDIESAGGDDRRRELQQAARDRGVFAPHAPVEFGGHGLSMTERAPIFEEAGFSLFGPTALNVAAPDEGNVHLLAHIANEQQKLQYLAPLAKGEVRSAFAMTEPAPGAGSDPSALLTSAALVRDGWRINGKKWFITGAKGAAFFIVMARTSGPANNRDGATMFLVPADTPGLSIGRHIRTPDRSMVGGHCEVLFDQVLVPPDSILGELDQGFANAQVRLGPARMTHVMRWLGASRRAHEIAVDHISDRQAFGSAIGDLGMAEKMIADNEIDIAATRALLLQACHALDLGQRASMETSIRQDFCCGGDMSHCGPLSSTLRWDGRLGRSSTGTSIPRSASVSYL